MSNILTNNYNENQSLLFITNDVDLITNINNSNIICKEKKFCSNKNDYTSYINKLNEFEIIIYDANSEEEIIKFSSFYNQIIELENSIILLEKDLKADYLTTDYSNIFSFLNIGSNYDLLINNIHLCQRYINKRKRIDFTDGISFFYKSNSLVNNKQEIELTKSERLIIELLINNLNKIVKYKELEDYLWKDKNFSKDTLRNKIRNIRKKTNSTFIKNVSKKGYILNNI